MKHKLHKFELIVLCFIIMSCILYRTDQKIIFNSEEQIQIEKDQTTLEDSFSLFDWQYYIEFKIKNNNITIFDNDNLELNVNTAWLIQTNRMNPDGSDILFFLENGTYLPYFIKSGLNTTDTKILVKIPHIEGNEEKTLYMLFGNPMANPNSNVRRALSFYEGFEDNDPNFDVIPTGDAQYERNNFTSYYESYSLKTYNPNPTIASIEYRFELNYAYGIYKIEYAWKEIGSFSQFLNVRIDGLYKAGSDSPIYNTTWFNNSFNHEGPIGTLSFTISNISQSSESYLDHIMIYKQRPEFGAVDDFIILNSTAHKFGGFDIDDSKNIMLASNFFRGPGVQIMSLVNNSIISNISLPNDGTIKTPAINKMNSTAYVSGYYNGWFVINYTDINAPNITISRT
jgi:hypothetical protein